MHSSANDISHKLATILANLYDKTASTLAILFALCRIFLSQYDDRGNEINTLFKRKEFSILIKNKLMKREYNVIIEKDSDGYFIGSVPELKGCHSQAKSIDELMIRMQEIIELCEEVLGKSNKKTKFIGIQKMVLG